MLTQSQIEKLEEARKIIESITDELPNSKERSELIDVNTTILRIQGELN